MSSYGPGTIAAQSTTAYCTNKDHDDATANDRRYVCTCPAGYVGNGDAAQGTGNSCTDEDEAGDASCFCDSDATCTSQTGGYSCRCNAGYYGAKAYATGSHTYRGVSVSITGATGCTVIAVCHTDCFSGNTGST